MIDFLFRHWDTARLAWRTFGNVLMVALLFGLALFLMVGCGSPAWYSPARNPTAAEALDLIAEDARQEWCRSGTVKAELYGELCW